jgi:outer membrane protein assembly factor BamD (BamD/ComL family)
MVTRFLLALLCTTFTLGFTACKKNPQDQKAAVEAKWRADQKQKAIKNYQEIVKKYPESPYASKAKERLTALSPAPAAGKK